jgi:hypothetical protein
MRYGRCLDQARTHQDNLDEFRSVRIGRRRGSHMKDGVLSAHERRSADSPSGQRDRERHRGGRGAQSLTKQIKADRTRSERDRDSGAVTEDSQDIS